MNHIPRRASFICRSCRQSSVAKSTRRCFIWQAASPWNQETYTTPRKIPAIPLRQRSARRAETSASDKTTLKREREATVARDGSAEGPLIPVDPAQKLQDFEKFVARIESTDAAADYDDVIEKLMDMYEFSNVLVHGSSKIPEEQIDVTTTSRTQGSELEHALLEDLSEGESTQASISPTQQEIHQQMTLNFRTKAASTISTLSYTLLRSPKVYITEGMLQIYVRILCQLGKPEFVPEIFHLYATKPIPQTKTGNPIRYSQPWPSMPKYAVPIALAEAVLEAAILKKNLPLALAVIDTTVASPAFRTSKVLRQASIPGLIVGSTPFVAYAGADWVSHWQNTMDVEMAKYTAVAGALAYIGTLSTIGFVAVTTWNDQMQRVVWRPGTHLSSRWLREDERRFFDRLALAWGFQERKRWGEESGAEWARLRDECGGRDMILDKTDLMDGMQ